MQIGAGLLQGSPQFAIRDSFVPARDIQSRRFPDDILTMALRSKTQKTKGE
jgi:hypothetical protein